MRRPIRRRWKFLGGALLVAQSIAVATQALPGYIGAAGTAVFFIFSTIGAAALMGLFIP